MRGAPRRGVSTPIGPDRPGEAVVAVRSARPADHDDVSQLRALGYEQELRRGLGGVGNTLVGFATISPIVGLYAVGLVGTTVAGPAWVWMLLVCLLGQLLVAAVYAELASQFPISGGAYQWTRRLVGPGYAWFTGWLAIWSYLVANTTVAYLAAPWMLALAGVEPTPLRLVAVAALFVLTCALVNTFGVGLLRWATSIGAVAEGVASVLVGLTLLLFFRTQDFSLLFDTLDAPAALGGTTGAAMLAALAVAGWAFIGFDACIAASEETRRAARNVPRGVWYSLLAAGLIVVLNAVAMELAHPDPARVVAGADVDPVTTAVVHAFGSWSARPFTLVVLVGFFACGLAAQAASARTVFSIARDGVLPASRFLRRVNHRQTPWGATLVVAAVALAGLVLGLHSAAIGSLIAFGTACVYLMLLFITVAALVARLRKRWIPGGTIRLGRAGVAVNALAVVWLLFEFVNVAWPRAVLAPVGASWYQIWAAVLITAFVAVTGVGYLLVGPQRLRSTTPSSKGNESWKR